MNLDASLLSDIPRILVTLLLTRGSNKTSFRKELPKVFKLTEPISHLQLNADNLQLWSDPAQPEI